MDANVCTQVKVERKALSAPFERALKRLLARVNQLMSFQFARFDKSLSTLGADMNTRTVSVQMLSHRAVIPKHF